MENDPNAMVLDHEPVAKKQATRAIDCQEEMKTRIVDLVNSEHSLPPKTIHDMVQKEMDLKYPMGHIPLRVETAINLVKNTKAGGTPSHNERCAWRTSHRSRSRCAWRTFTHLKLE